MTATSMRNRCLLATSLLLTLTPAVFAKLDSGNFKFTASKTDHVITSYSIAGGAGGLMTTVMLAKDELKNHDDMTLHLYMDDDWGKVKKAKSCSEKLQYSRQSADVKFALETEEEAKMWGFRKPRWRSEIHMKIERVQEEVQGKMPKHHYWYVVVDDCSLEGNAFKASKVPQIEYHIQIYNQLSEKMLTHLSTDDFHSNGTHTFTMLFSGTICILLFAKIMYHLRISGIVHIAKFFVMGAAALDTASSMCELVHMFFYRMDGMGFYTFDAFSAYLEALCDGLVCFLFLAIGAGWTLPSDVISINRNEDNGTLVQKILLGLADPTGASSWLNPFSGALMGMISVHGFLAHWGLSYNDDFDSYHDLEHTPGKILMTFRSLMGMFMLAAVINRRAKCNASLQPFYASFAIVGTIWFQALPVITWFCNNFMPFHQRHPTIIQSSAILQSTSLLLLSWLVAVHDSSPYHKVSHMTQSRDDNLTEKLSGAGACMWSFPFKTKIRLD